MKERHWKRAFARRAYPYLLLAFDAGVVTALYCGLIWLVGDEAAFRGISPRIVGSIIVANSFGLYLIGGYNYRTDKRTFRFVSEHLIVSAVVFVAVFFLVFSVVAYGETVNTPRSVISTVLVVFPILSIALRFGLGVVQSRLQTGNALCIIGTDGAARDLYRRLKAARWSVNMVVVDSEPGRVGHFLDPEDPESPIVRWIGDIGLDSSIDGRYVESYVMTVPLGELPEKFAHRLVRSQLGGHQVYTVSSFLTKELRIEPPAEVSLEWAFEEGFRLHRSVSYDRLKRLSDILLAAIGLLFAAVPIALMALVQKLTSRGPVFFAQTRVGKGEVPFTLYKIRSMAVGSELEGPYTVENDRRVTPLGRFMRMVRLDELPQLWNVLRGDMSLIGPRAEWDQLVRDYETKIPFYHFRHAVKPGITGWAQVNYNYGGGADDALEKLCYDLYYVRHYSILLDVSIMVKTAYIMIFGKGQ